MDKLDAKIIVASYSITCSQIRRFAISLIVEGSSDGGSNWYVLDRQTSQKFDSYFQRKLYRVGSRHTQSNAIRFTFLSVRDVKSTLRLQICSIYLYAGNC
ncbi:peptide-N(4)-(N-acetyl-beta-glucosaminyl)asparagine amidase-like isoform X2 [Chenopodium quinoa]|uniref:peptide-N(4)-(N-acetyl-beta- glucosaminyl)asparagine amidase-like isoform X2 n=1 Tax=Chenopodium quinoa TaxID=63459 RepID=UPI000B798C55|nr:peptide-N(4)-(N-acetyl-beta-glucosaminyl)asparagine amidase-like isoform X2 [Chenopodium quinoa]